MQGTDRLAWATLTLYLASAARFADGSFAATTLQAGGWPAALCITALAVMAALALFDAMINDLMPARFSWGYGVRWRQAIWAWLGVTLGGLFFVDLRSGQPGAWMAALHLLVGMRCVSVAWFDLWHEHTQRLCSLTCPVDGAGAADVRDARATIDTGVPHA
jgi:hypothetical protein